MITTSELAGFFAAHAAWSLSDADTFDPMVAYTTPDGKRGMERVIGRTTESAVESGWAQLAADKWDAVDAVLLSDGRISTDGGKLDAIIIEMRCYGFPRAEAVIAVPYTPRSTGRFRVHKPKVMVWKDCEDFDMDMAFEAFFRGVDSHEQGGRIWNECLDQSK